EGAMSGRKGGRPGRGEHLFLEDLGSQNGPFLDDERLAGPRELLVGQRIHIGPAVLRLRVPGGGTRTDRPRRRMASHPEPSALPARTAVLAAAAGVLPPPAPAVGVGAEHPGWVAAQSPASPVPPHRGGWGGRAGRRVL